MADQSASERRSIDDETQGGAPAAGGAVEVVTGLPPGEPVLPRPEELGIGLLFWYMRDAAVIGEAASGRIVLWNPAAAVLFGYEADEVVGRSLEILVPESLRGRHRAGIAQFAVTGRGPLVEAEHPVEVPALRKGGEEIAVELVLTPIVQDRVPGRFVLALLRDVSARKRVEAALQAANRELEAFSYSVSHDLRSPLRAIDGFSRILLEEYAAELPPEAQRYLGRVRDGAQRMGQLIDDLLAFSRLGRQPLAVRTVAPTEIVRAVLADLAGERTGRAVEVVLGDLPPCRADPALLRQVFANLLSNAFKYTRGRAVARIEVGSRDDLAQPGERVYIVRDNGAGFDLAYADKLFRVFQRLHRSEEFEGTGVGLALVQRIVHRHGGRVWAEAAVDQGATFFVALPAAEPDPGPAGPEMAEPAP